MVSQNADRVASQANHATTQALVGEVQKSMDVSLVRRDEFAV